MRLAMVALTLALAGCATAPPPSGGFARCDLHFDAALDRSGPFAEDRDGEPLTLMVSDRPAPSIAVSTMEGSVLGRITSGIYFDDLVVCLAEGETYRAYLAETPNWVAIRWRPSPAN